MRISVVWMSLSILGASLVAGCGWQGAGPCKGEDCPPADSQCDGLCVPYMDSTWDMALVGMELPDRNPLRCPSVAPFAGMSGKEIPLSRGPARDVLACNVNPRPTCASDAFVCVPFDPQFAPCILQPGDQLCPDPYSLPTFVENAAGYTITVCCEDPEDVP